jgi:WD40 repeat protein
MQGKWRQYRRNTAILVLGVLFVSIAWWMSRSDLPTNDSRASILSLFVGLAALSLGIAESLRTRAERPATPEELADDLAATIRTQWMEESKARGLRDSGILPVTWSASIRKVGDRTAAVAGRMEAGRLLRLRLDGRLESGFDQALFKLANDYRQIPSGRLVILGEPGAGKTVLAILLTLGLIDPSTRISGSPTPVLLAASSWDPTKESMDEWIVRSVAGSYYGGRSRVPRALNDLRLLLPIIDGLDEIPESVRRTAVRAISQAIGQERPVVVTCRSEEFEDCIAGGAPVLRKAPVVEVAPVDVDDVIAYFSDLSWPAGTNWTPVFEDLRKNPDSPMAVALSTPLIVSIACRVYQRLGGNPDQLLDSRQFDSRHAVEDHFIDRMIDAAFEFQQGRRQTWPPHKARRWLTYIAHYLHEHRERDFAWWRISERTMSPWVAVGVGLATGFFGMILSIAILGIVLATEAQYMPQEISQQVVSKVLLVLGPIALYFGLLLALPTTVAWFVGGRRGPGRLAFVAAGSASRLRRGLRVGASLTAILLVPTLIFLAVFYFIPIDNKVSYGNIIVADPSQVVSFWHWFLLGIALACVIGMALAMHSWLDAPREKSGLVNPTTSIRQDRKSALVGSGMAGVVFILTLYPTLVMAKVFAYLLQEIRTGWTSEPNFVEIVSLAREEISSYAGFAQVSDGIFVGVLLAWLIFMTRAWPRFVVARVVLGLRGKFPWRLMKFLRYARQQEILRESGVMYQFRHARVQEWLANQPEPEHQSRVLGRPWKYSKRRIAVVLAITVVCLLLIWNGLLGKLPRDYSLATVLTGPEWAMSDTADIVAVVDQDRRGIAIWQLNIRDNELRQTVRIDKDFIGDIKLSHDGHRLAFVQGSTGAGEVWLWDVNGDPGDVKRINGLRAPLESIQFLGFSPDNQYLSVRVEREDVSLPNLWQVNTQNEELEDALPAPVALDGSPPILFSPDSKTLITSPVWSASVWDLRSRRLRSWPTTNVEQPIGPIAFSPNAQTLAAVSSTGGSTWLWDATKGRARLRLRISRELPLFNVERLEFSPDSRMLATGEGGGDYSMRTVRLWDVATGRQRADLKRHDKFYSSSPFFSLDGRKLVTLAYRYGDDIESPLVSTIDIWDPVTARLQHKIPSPTEQPMDVIFSPDMHTFATVSKGPSYAHVVWLWNLDTGELRDTLIGHTAGIHTVRFSRDGRFILTVANDKTIRLWRLT